MTFKEQMVEEYITKQVTNLKERLSKASAAGRRDYTINLTYKDIEEVRTGFFTSKYQVVGYGKIIWDALVDLGFEPQLNMYYDLADIIAPHLIVEW